MSTLQERLRHIHMELTVDDYDDVITAAADALDAAEAENLRLTAYAVNVGCDNEGLRQERDAAQAKLDAIDALHQPYESHMAGAVCEGCGNLWPCSTHLAINPEEGTDE